MTLRNLVLIGSLATVLGGCVVAPAPHAHRHYDDRDYYYSDDDYYDYHETPSYEGYYYVRVIFIGNDPYYVDDDRYVRPIPPHMHDHFRTSPFRNKDRHAPVFSRDRESRDGYSMSRIVYLNDVPYYVEDGRVARPLPNHMHDRFRPSPFTQGNGRNNDSRPLPPATVNPGYERRNEPSAYNREPPRYTPPAHGRDEERNMPPANGRDRQRNEPPAYGRGHERNEPPAYGRENGRREPPAFGRDREHNQPPAYGRDTDRNPPPTYGRERERYQPPLASPERERMRDPREHRDAAPQQRDERSRPSPFANNERPMPPGRNDRRQGAPGPEQGRQPQPAQRNAADPRGAPAIIVERNAPPQGKQPAKEKDQSKDVKEDGHGDENGKKKERD